MSTEQKVYVVIGNLGEEDPAVFADQDDADEYAEALSGSFAGPVGVYPLLVCDGELAAKMIEEASATDPEEDDLNSEKGWQVCAPGDPTNSQWDRLNVLAGSDHATMVAYNATTHQTRGVIDRANGEQETWEITEAGNAIRVSNSL